jgi:hypothetical protein
MIRTRCAGLVGAMMPCRLCCPRADGAPMRGAGGARAALRTR